MNFTTPSRSLVCIVSITFSCLVILFSRHVSAGVSYKDPAGGWLYQLDGSQDASDELEALDGGWTHDINDTWDESQPGEEGTAPGGVISITEGDVTYLRIQDAGDPRDLGFPDPGNRKFTFNRNLVELDDVSESYLDDGFTFSFRGRLATTGVLDDMTFGGSEEPWPEGGRGYDIDFDGTGFFMFMQKGSDLDNIGPISFSLADPEFGLQDIGGGDVGGLIMNNIVDEFPSPEVDTHEAFEDEMLNLVPIEDLTQWHEFWITIQASDGGAGTHSVNVYVDGSTDPFVHEVTMGSANRAEDATISPSYTAGAIALDLDFYAYHEGVLIPESADGGPPMPRLQAGDADQNLDFDQLDLVQVQIAAKYLTGDPATWGDGDWNGAPGGKQGEPPAGDGQFNQLDIIAALNAGTYLTGPYAANFAAVAKDGTAGDDQTSLVYNRGTGELAVDAPAGKELTSINITSAGSQFIGDKPVVLDGAFDNFAADNVFKATFGGSFGSISFGNVLPAGLAEDDVAADLSAVGSLSGGGDLGTVDLIYIPEPGAALLLLLGATAICACGRTQTRKV